MNKETNEVINNLCDKFGCALEDLAPELARMRMITEMAIILVGIIFVIVGIICLYISFKEYNKKVEYHHFYTNTTYYEKGNYEIWLTIGIVLFIIAAILIIPAIIACYQWLAAPKAMTIIYILNHVG